MGYFRPDATWLKSTVKRGAKLYVPFKDTGTAYGPPPFALGDITSGAET